ncbi:MAG: DUF6206 family protein [Candidatus Hodarchaeota archaeon]
MNVNIELLKEFEKTIDTAHPEKGKIPAKVLGSGEMSVVIEILNDPENLVYKRMPIFDTEQQAKKHKFVFKTYNRILNQNLDIVTPDFEIVWFKDDEGKIAFYGIQEKILTESIGNNVIHQVSDREVINLVLLALKEMKKIWSFNKKKTKLQVGFDAQISNFAIVDYDPESPSVDENTKLIYIDTVPPFFRVNGKEAMEIKFVVKSIPWFLRTALYYLFAPGIINGYYDWRVTAVDMIANFFKEQKPEIIPRLVREVNKFFAREAKEFDIKPITVKEVVKYYKFDKFVWVLLYNMRRIDRFIKKRIFKKKYIFYIPEKIKR